MMKIISIAVILVMGFSGFLLAEPQGKETKSSLITQGQQVYVNYTCICDRYGVFDTTLARVAEDDTLKKSRVFVRYAEYKPLMVIAGMDQPGQSPGDLKLLEPEIRTQIAHALVGKKIGKSYDIVLESSIPEGIEGAHRYRNIERVRTVPRYKTISRQSFARGRDKPPEQGEIFYKDNHPYAKIVKMDKENITMKLIVDEKLAVESPWGTVTAVGDEKTVTVTIASHVGRLVRTGGVIGRVSEITQKNIVVDYGHPFAGETLKCRVEILDSPPGKTSRKSDMKSAQQQGEK